MVAATWMARKLTVLEAIPDNWQDIIDLINKTANEYATAGNGTTISKVDVDFVREHERLYLDESVLPEDLTLEDLLRSLRRRITFP